MFNVNYPFFFYVNRPSLFPFPFQFLQHVLLLVTNVFWMLPEDGSHCTHSSIFFVHSGLFDLGATVVLNIWLDICDTFIILFHISPELGSC